MELLAEIERLRDENEKLLAARRSDSHTGRRAATVVLIVLGALLLRAQVAILAVALLGEWASVRRGMRRVVREA